LRLFNNLSLQNFLLSIFDGFDFICAKLKGSGNSSMLMKLKFCQTRPLGIMLMVLLFTGSHAMSTEEAKYTVLSKLDKFELRLYAPQVLAETVVAGSLEEAGGKAFGRLFGYITGENKGNQKIAMTAPVSQQAAGEKIAMTTPVGQVEAEGGWSVSFMMPPGRTLESLPEPKNAAIKLIALPQQQMATIRYSGTSAEKLYRKNLAELETWIKQQGLKPTGKPVWARYNPPYTPWFLRRNEILMPVETRP